MSIANFFNKNALSAAQILQNVSRDDFEKILLKQVVEIVFDETIQLTEARVVLELVCNLISRLYPVIAMTYCGEDAAVTKEYIDNIRAINPDIEISIDEFTPTVSIVIGRTSITRNTPVIYVGSDNWIAKLSTSNPVGSGITTNPIGAVASACFAAANTFRHIFKDYLKRHDLDDHIELSLFTFSQQETQDWNPALKPIEIPDTYLVGLGAIGHGALWTLARLPVLTGNLHLIDAECIDLSNLQRYVGATQTSIDTKKADLGEELLDSTGLTLHPHTTEWGHYLAKREDFNLDTVLVAVDNAETRRMIQGSLPRFIINSWTQTADLGVSRHRFDDHQACLTCLYFPKGTETARDLIVAEAIGLPDKRMDVRRMLAMDIPLNNAFLEEIAAANSISPDSLCSFEGKTLDVFYAEAICGGVLLKLNPSALPTEPQAEVPMAFQSALAGIMLIADWLAHIIEPEMPRETKTIVNMLRPLAIQSQNIKKHPSGHCICEDTIYLDVYRAKYLLTPSK